MWRVLFLRELVRARLPLLQFPTIPSMLLCPHHPVLIPVTYLEETSPSFESEDPFGIVRDE
jgi:hypothetical protein